MTKFELLKLQKLFRIQNSIKPKTYLDELASEGYLEDFIEPFFKNKINEDSDFKNRIYDSLYDWSDEVSEKLELYYLESICESLSFFNEYTKLWKTQKQ